jgi:uncharacterized protein YjdB
VAVTGVGLNKTSTTMSIGGTETLTATVTPSNATNKNITWSSNNTALATVSSTGLITAVSVGTAIITVTTQDGSHRAACVVIVTATTGVAVADVGLNKTSTTISVGSTEQLTETVVPSNATNKAVSWSSNNTAVATVSSTGLITAVSEGMAAITVTTQDGGKIASCAVNVTTAASGVAVTDISLNKTSTTIGAGEIEMLTATISPTNATNQTVTWNSSNTAVAMVSSTGKVTAISAGTAIITVTTQDGNHTAICAVTVTDGSTAVGTAHTMSLQVYPNPVTNEQLIVSNEQLKAGDRIEVYSLSGAKLKTFAATGAKSSIDLSALPTGTYVVKAGNRVAKVVK